MRSFQSDAPATDPLEYDKTHSFETMTINLLQTLPIYNSCISERRLHESYRANKLGSFRWAISISNQKPNFQI